MPIKKVDEIAAELTVHDNNGNIKAKALGELLSETRKPGTGFSLNQCIPESGSMAAAVWSGRGDLYALVISRPSFRFIRDKVHEVIPDLKQCASNLITRRGGSNFVTTWSLKEGRSDW